jgi:hypothetical protein
VEHLRPELARAIHEHAQQQRLGNVAAEALMCCETETEKIITNRLDAWLSGNPDMISYLALVVTPQRLIWARSGDRSAVVAVSAQLIDLRVKVFRPRGTQDFGLQIYGRMAGTRTRVGGQLLLGSEPAAQKFCEEVGQAMERLNPPQKRTGLRWPGH